MTDKEKIREYLRSKGIKDTDFYKKTGLSNGFLDSGKGIGSDKLKIIISNYPDLNLNWLLFDEGNMLNSTPGNYYQPNNNVDVISEKQASYSGNDPFCKLLLNMIDKKDMQILELSEKIGQLRQELKELLRK